MNIQMTNRNRRSAFTVVELLVVIAVIGILASIVIVSYSGTQKKADMSALNTTAQQVRLKLGDHMTDRNRYPSVQGVTATTADSVLKYLSDSGDTTLSTEFGKKTSGGADVFNYVASPVGCNNTTTICTSYTITVTRDKWSGPASDQNITVYP